MKNPVIRTLAWIISLTILSVIVGFGVFIWTFDPTKLVTALKARIERSTHYQVNVNGPITWSFYRGFTIAVPQVTLQATNEPTPTLTLQNVFVSWVPWKKISQNNHATIDIAVTQALFKRIHAEKLIATLEWQEDAMHIDGVSEFYQGSMKGNIAYYQQLRKWDWQLALENCEMEKLLIDLRGGTSFFTLAGRFQGQFNGNIASKTDSEWLRQLNGTMQFRIHQGAIKGADLNYFIDKGVALLKHTSSNAEATSQTLFQEFSGSAKIEDGALSTQDLLLEANTFKGTAQGDILLLDKNIDFALQIQPKNEKRWSIPILITGPWQKPTISLDTLIIQTILTKEQIEKLKEKVKKQIEKLPEETNAILNRIFDSSND